MVTRKITKSFRSNLVKTLLETSGVRPLYVYYSRPNEYENGNGEVVPKVVDSVLNENEIKANMMSLKRIQRADMTVGCRKIEWEPNKIYDQYDDGVNIKDLDYYVITDTRDVFKCISNGSKGPNDDPKESTHKPTRGILNYPDGYIWKFMFKVPQRTLRKFSFVNDIPIVENSLAISSAVPGTLDRIDIINPGEDYVLLDVFNDSEALEYIPLYIKGDGESNESGVCTIAVNNSNEITDIVEIDEEGSSYRITPGKYTPVKIRQIEREILLGDEFEFAYGFAELSSSGEILNIHITNPGKGYNAGPATISQSSAIAYGILNGDNEVESVEIDYSGFDFSYCEIIPIFDAGINLQLKPVLSPYFGHGSDPIEELNGDRLLINSRIALDENLDFTVENDFRKYGVISEVKQFDSKNNIVSAFSNSLNAKESIFIKEEINDNIAEDSTVFGKTSGAKAFLIDSINGKELRVIRSYETSNSIPFIQGEEIKIRPGEFKFTIESIQKPEYVLQSGQILYINNIEPIKRSEAQIESLNFSIKF